MNSSLSKKKKKMVSKILCQRKFTIKKQNNGQPFKFLVLLCKFLFIFLFFIFSIFELFCVCFDFRFWLLCLICECVAFFN